MDKEMLAAIHLLITHYTAEELYIRRVVENEYDVYFRRNRRWFTTNVSPRSGYVGADWHVSDIMASLHNLDVEWSHHVIAS
jgi:hypothetical protein